MDNQEDQTIAMAERVSNAMVNAMAPLIEKLGNEEGREGLILLGTSMVSTDINPLVRKLCKSDFEMPAAPCCIYCLSFCFWRLLSLTIVLPSKDDITWRFFVYLFHFKVLFDPVY